MSGRRIASAAVAALLAAGCGGGSSRADCEPLADRADALFGVPAGPARARLIDRCTEVLSKGDIKCALANDRCLVKVMARLEERGRFSLNPLAGAAEERRHQAELEMRRARVEAERRQVEYEQFLASQARLEAELQAKRDQLEEAEARQDPRRVQLEREYQVLVERVKELDLARPRAESGPEPTKLLGCAPGDPLCP